MLDVQTLAPRPATLSDDNVQLWVCPFDSVRGRLGELREHLSADECARADRFYFSRDRDRFVCWRGVLREFLGVYTGSHPSSVQFTYAEFGKPLLAAAHGRSTVHFNVSHSGELGLFGFCRNRAIGVDIERVEEDFDFLSIALQYLSPSERRLLDRLSSEDRLSEFYRCWTRREAFLKGIGSGLLGLTQTLEVHEGLNRPTTAAEGEWTVQALEIDNGYCASLALEGGAPWSLTQ